MRLFRNLGLLGLMMGYLALLPAARADFNSCLASCGSHYTGGSPDYYCQQACYQMGAGQAHGLDWAHDYTSCQVWCDNAQNVPPAYSGDCNYGCNVYGRY
jgi:hypothetical protein